MKYNVRIAVDSDAHFYTRLGEFAPALLMLDEICFPDDLIINSSVENFKKYMNEKNIEI